MSNQKQNGSIIAIITMMFLYAMISFVTNLGAPIGVIWKNQPEIGGSNVLGIMGNFMNFFAYLFMGIPAGKMLTKVGYKKTALIGIAVGFVGVLISLRCLYLRFCRLHPEHRCKPDAEPAWRRW